MQPELSEHFHSEVHNGFLPDCSITFTDKTDGESAYGDLSFQCYCLLAFTGFARQRGSFRAGVLHAFGVSFR